MKSTSCIGSLSLLLTPFLSFAYSSPSRRSNRDIKPDNILLDEHGHAHLTDFNIAVHYSERRLLTGVAGSMAYMAPEILHKRGYTYPIDWWSLGVCAYELIFGRRPFRGRTNTALTHSISKDALRFPENADEKCSKTGLPLIGKNSRLRLYLTWVTLIIIIIHNSLLCAVYSRRRRTLTRPMN